MGHVRINVLAQGDGKDLEQRDDRIGRAKQPHQGCAARGRGQEDHTRKGIGDLQKVAGDENGYAHLQQR